MAALLDATPHALDVELGGRETAVPDPDGDALPRRLFEKRNDRSATQRRLEREALLARDRPLEHPLSSRPRRAVGLACGHLRPATPELPCGFVGIEVAHACLPEERAADAALAGSVRP